MQHLAARLDSVDELPPWFFDAIQPFIPELSKQRFLDRMYEDRSFSRLIVDLDQSCLERGVVGYHYTRADDHDIRRQGLLALPGDEHRSRFIERYGARFTNKQLDRIRLAWADYFTKQQRSGRDSLVFFNLTQEALNNGGAEALLTYYGGEAIYMPLVEHTDIADVLRTIGEPKIVECHLDARSTMAFTTNPWGKIWMSTFHRSINADAYCVDQDAHVNVSLAPERVLSIGTLSRDR